jgi:hypothetical protein
VTGTVRGIHLKSNGGTVAERKFRAPFWAMENNHASLGAGPACLTFLSGFEGIDGGKATTSEDGIDSLHCQVMYLRALIKRNPPEGLIDRFRQVHARVDYGRPSVGEPRLGKSHLIEELIPDYAIAARERPRGARERGRALVGPGYCVHERVTV